MQKLDVTANGYHRVILDICGKPVDLHYIKNWTNSRHTIYWHTSQFRKVTRDGQTYYVARYNLLASTWSKDTCDGILYWVVELAPGWVGEHTHSMIHSRDGTHYGDIVSRKLPANLEALPAMTTERSEAVGAYHESLRTLARTIARAAYPEYGAHENGITLA